MKVEIIYKDGAVAIHTNIFYVTMIPEQNSLKLLFKSGAIEILNFELIKYWSVACEKTK